MLMANNSKLSIGLKPAVDCGYVPAKIGHGLLLQYESVGKMLNSMMTKASSFCNGSNHA